MNEITISERRVISIWGNWDLWQQFKIKCRQLGQSTCHLQEAFWYSIVHGGSATSGSMPPITINMKVNRVVQKARRMDREQRYNRQWHKTRVVHPNGRWYYL